MAGYQIRRADPGDTSLIVASFTKTLRGASHLSLHIDDDSLWAGCSNLLNQLLSSPSIKALVACDAEDPTTDYGWCVVERGVVHGIYVKRSFRRMGIARALLEAAGVDLSKPIPCSTWSRDAAAIHTRHPLAYSWFRLLEVQ